MREALQAIDLQIQDANEARELFGTNDIFLKRIEQQLNVSIVTRGEHIQVDGNEANLVQTVLSHLLEVIRKGIDLSERDVIYAIKLAKENKIDHFLTLFEDEITKNAQGKSIR